MSGKRTQQVRPGAPVHGAALTQGLSALSSTPRAADPGDTLQCLGCPFQTDLYGSRQGDAFPASYHTGADRQQTVCDPIENVTDFVTREFSLGYLDEITDYLWFAGAKRPPMQLHWQVALGRDVVAVDRMDLHLLWDSSGRLFVKPLPLFLLDPTFWQQHLTSGRDHIDPKRQTGTLGGAARSVALGYLWTYVCLLSSETDFQIANEQRLLPRDAHDGVIISWDAWKTLAREILHSSNSPESWSIHPRFLRAELRLSRVNTIHRFTRLPPFNPYLRGWHSYSSLVHDNLTWMATVTIFVALVLTAMQVGLATNQLQGNLAFQQASYGFAVFAILGPICVFGAIVVAALFNLLKDLPGLYLNNTQAKTGRQCLDTGV